MCVCTVTMTESCWRNLGKLPTLHRCCFCRSLDKHLVIIWDCWQHDQQEKGKDGNEGGKPTKQLNLLTPLYLLVIASDYQAHLRVTTSASFPHFKVIQVPLWVRSKLKSISQDWRSWEICLCLQWYRQLLHTLILNSSSPVLEGPSVFMISPGALLKHSVILWKAFLIDN